MHWIHGGPTDLDNLITLCGYHHRLIHEGSWRITGDPNGQVTWINKWGKPHQPQPDQLTPQPDWLIDHAIHHYSQPQIRGPAQNDTF